MYQNDPNNSVSGTLTQIVLFLAIVGLLTIFGFGVYIGMWVQLNI